MHEGLESLTWLIKLRNNAIANEYARGMLKTLTKITDDYGAISPELVSKINRNVVFFGIGNVQTVTSERLVGVLVKYYRLTNDPLTLKLADKYSHYVMDRSFTGSGNLTDYAGNHIHSITSTIRGVLDYAIMTKDGNLIESVCRVYEVGLRGFYSNYGWCKEQAWLETDQGEVK